MYYARLNIPRNADVIFNEWLSFIFISWKNDARDEENFNQT